MQCHWWDWFLCPWIVLAPLFYLNCFLVCSLYVCIWVFLLLCSRRGRWCSSPVFEKYILSLLHWMPFFIVLSNNSYTSPTLLHQLCALKVHARILHVVGATVLLIIFICLFQGVLALGGLNDPDGNPVLICSCNDDSVHLYELPSWVSQSVLKSIRLKFISPYASV